MNFPKYFSEWSSNRQREDVMASLADVGWVVIQEEECSIRFVAEVRPKPSLEEGFPCFEKLTQACFLNKFVSGRSFSENSNNGKQGSLAENLYTWKWTCCPQSSNCQNYDPTGATETEYKQLGLYHIDYFDTTSSLMTPASTPTAPSTGAPPECVSCLSDSKVKRTKTQIC